MGGKYKEQHLEYYQEKIERMITAIATALDPLNKDVLPSIIFALCAIAVLVFASKQKRDTLAGGKLILGNELLETIFVDLQNRSIYSHTIPEQFPILRAFQFVAQYRKEVCSILYPNKIST